MSRNRNPEETKNLIIDVSYELFLSKGYEKTSLQDIINSLGGLTKGAIYHHFKSKEQILLAVVERLCRNNTLHMKQLLTDTSLNGKQKLEKIYYYSVNNSLNDKLFSVTPNLINNPTFLAFYVKIIKNYVLPEFLNPTILEGVKDGSIRTDCPEELSELIILFTDIWINPLIFGMSEDQLVKRVKMIDEILNNYGISLFCEETMKKLLFYRKFVN